MAATGEPDLNFLKSDDSRKVPQEPNWLTGDLGKYPCDWQCPTVQEGEAVGPIQQSDLVKPFMEDIRKKGLTYAYYKYAKHEHHPKHAIHQPTKYPSHVIIVGAGMAGLAAAYELAQVGHIVTILEMQERFGGRVKTFGEKEGFARGLYADAGAMRLPCRPDSPDKTHYLTDGYGEHFQLKSVPFLNFNDDAYLLFYNKEKTQIKDWKPSDFEELWPEWKKTLKEKGHADDVSDIDDYYNQTTGVITDQLRRQLAKAVSLEKQAEVWHKWIDCWCRFSLDGFLRSTLVAIKSQIPSGFDDGLEKLEYLLPWPEDAIDGYSVFTYTQQLDQSLVQYLRSQLGQWSSTHMHNFDGGMSTLPEAFVKPNTFGWNKDVHLYNNITFNVTVNKIIFDAPQDAKETKVVVKGFYSTSGRPFEVTGNAVIVTTPVHILRQIKFHAETGTEHVPNDFYRAIEDIWYGPATKIMIQSRTRFWEKEDESGVSIKGGYSRASIPIGQLHYPTQTSPEAGERGMLMVYVWKSEALLFGSLDPIVAAYEAVSQITEIHPEMLENFEMAAVEAWYNEPSAQGAYALLKPNQFRNVHYLMYPWKNLFFAGEAISFAAGWIQGALESGLRAAYQFYAQNEALHGN